MLTTDTVSVTTCVLCDLCCLTPVGRRRRWMTNSWGGSRMSPTSLPQHTWKVAQNWNTALHTYLCMCILVYLLTQTAVEAVSYTFYSHSNPGLSELNRPMFTEVVHVELSWSYYHNEHVQFANLGHGVVWGYWPPLNHS